MPETNFFWDPLSDNILQERDETGAVTAEYTTEPGLYGNLISQNRGGVESQYHFDAQGSTLALTDDAQQLTDTSAYTAFGKLSEQTGSTIYPYLYIARQGYYTLAVLDEYSVRRRTFSNGRWLSPDPLYLATTESQYTYSRNRPTYAFDPSGLAGIVYVPPVDSHPWKEDKIGGGYLALKQATADGVGGESSGSQRGRSVWGRWEDGPGCGCAMIVWKVSRFSERGAAAGRSGSSCGE